jgi:hypothetical protein
MSNDKKIPEYMRLKDTHSTMVKLDKLAAFAEELGISLNFFQQATFIQDNGLPQDHPQLRLEDTDNGEAISEWPPVFEYKVIFENPAYLADQKIKHEEYVKREAERERERLAKAKAEKEAHALQVEKAERAELARLQKKFRDK